ncbi:MAG: FAD-dependent oxidoreductase, partial [Kiritimatiellae bacterium]|nr:FAD-dependent oxidoreductase [Kiritimatiellia bacterium]
MKTYISTQRRRDAKTQRFFAKILSATLLLCVSALNILADVVRESARELPVIADVDVVVAGGGFAATAAAIAAKEAGASVFLVMPRQNPADDIISTRRLWAQEGDEGLEDTLLAATIPVTHNASFDYKPSSEATNSAHLDNSHVVLKDGVWGVVEKQTVQYDGAVDIDITPQEGDYRVTSVTMHYHVKSDYGSDSIEVLLDGVPVPGEAKTTSNSAYYTWTFTPSEPFAAREFTVRSGLSANAKRQLIGEIIVGTDGSFATDAASPVAFFKSIDTALRDADVDYFTNAQATDVLRDGEGKIAGIVIADRSGRQAVRAKAVVDATEWGNIARKAARMRKRPGSGATTKFTRVLTVNAADEIVLPEGYSAVEVPVAAATATINPNDLHPTRKSFSYELKNVAISKDFELADMDYRRINAINHAMRSDVWIRSVVDQSEKPFFVPPDAIASANGTVEAWPGTGGVPLAAFVPEGMDNLWVAGMAADFDAAIAERLSFPGIAATIGRRIGKEAAAAAKKISIAWEVSCGEEIAGSADGCEVKEPLRRPINVGNEK